MVATPIGNLSDITFRAITTLKAVSRVIAEDTRHAQHLLNHYEIKKPLISLHQFNEQKRIDLIFSYLEQGEDIALISDAGTPLISDPGFSLVKAIREKEGKVIPIPGPCALITALSAAGVATTSFHFKGFFPAKSKERGLLIESVLYEVDTLIFYEAPHRILDTLMQLNQLMPTRQIIIARELTKLYEEFITGNAAQILNYFAKFSEKVRGEMVVLIEGARPEPTTYQESEKLLKTLLEELPTKQAVKLAAKMTGQNKRMLYQLALQLKPE